MIVYCTHRSGLMELAEFSDLVGALRKAQSHAMASELGSLRAQLGKPPSPSPPARSSARR